MTPDERTRMRATLRTAVSRARLPGAGLTHPGPFTPPSVPAGDLLQRFTSEFTTLGGVLHEGRDAAQVASIIAGLAAAERNTTVMAWDEHSLPLAGLHAALANAGLTVLTQSPDTAASAPHRRALAAAGVGVTGADSLIAQTGSMILTSGPGRGRLASLLPRVHVAIARRGVIAATLPALLNARPELVTSGANFVCITGPSRTADIEHVLARGVHGPGEVHVVLVD